MSAQPAEEARAPLFETRLFNLSPLPAWASGAVIAALVYGIYLLIAVQVGQPIIETGGEGPARFNSGSWAALVLSLILAASLAMQAMADRQWRDACEDVAATLDPDGARTARAMAEGASAGRARQLRLAFVLGAVIGGAAFNAWLFDEAGLSLSGYLQSTGAWFAVVAPLLFGLGSRAAVQLRLDDRDMVDLVTGHLTVRPARFDRLEVYGRLALRGALAWIVMAAIILLFFVYAAPIAISVGTLVFSLCAAGYVFFSTSAPVMRAASAIRTAALDDVRTHIEREAQSMLHQAGQAPPASGRLAELIAYEAWLEKRPVWPISAPVTRRLALYGFIPVLAWFGAAAAELALERLA